MGLCGVHWTVIGMDWKWDAPRIAKHVLGRTREGGIVCLHDGDRTGAETNRAQTLEAVQAIVPRLRERGFRFVALPGWEAQT
jgi:peptidoglycan/xylan/chitin deacetylase (PgdA/CDA1 family)